jgi:hypothetical protein
MLSSTAPGIISVQEDLFRIMELIWSRKERYFLSFLLSQLNERAGAAKLIFEHYAITMKDGMSFNSLKQDIWKRQTFGPIRWSGATSQFADCLQHKFESICTGMNPYVRSEKVAA